MCELSGLRLQPFLLRSSVTQEIPVIAHHMASILGRCCESVFAAAVVNAAVSPFLANFRLQPTCETPGRKSFEFCTQPEAQCRPRRVLDPREGQVPWGVIVAGANASRQRFVGWLVLLCCAGCQSDHAARLAAAVDGELFAGRLHCGGEFVGFDRAVLGEQARELYSCCPHRLWFVVPRHVRGGQSASHRRLLPTDESTRPHR